jgi:hypothetical protein
MKNLYYTTLVRGTALGLVFATISLSVVTKDLAATATTATDSVKKTKGKKLVGPQMGMLNSLLAGVPIATIQMSMTHREAVKISNALPTIEDQKEHITKHVKSLLAPVRDSLTLIKQHVNMVLPLIHESLGKERVQASLLVKAFVGSDTVEQYFEKNIVTKQSLQALSEDFATFFSDIQASLSAEAIAAYKAEVAKIKAETEKNRARN